MKTGRKQKKRNNPNKQQQTPPRQTALEQQHWDVARDSRGLEPWLKSKRSVPAPALIT